MIKNGTYIRSFTDDQRNKMKLIGDAEKLKTAPDILFFTLDQYLDQKKEIARLNRIIEYKQRKIERITAPES